MVRNLWMTTEMSWRSERENSGSFLIRKLRTMPRTRLLIPKGITASTMTLVGRTILPGALLAMRDGTLRHIQASWGLRPFWPQVSLTLPTKSCFYKQVLLRWSITEW